MGWGELVSRSSSPAWRAGGGLTEPGALTKPGAGTRASSIPRPGELSRQTQLRSIEIHDSSLVSSTAAQDVSKSLEMERQEDVFRSSRLNACWPFWLRSDSEATPRAPERNERLLLACLHACFLPYSLLPDPLRLPCPTRWRMPSIRRHACKSLRLSHSTWSQPSSCVPQSRFPSREVAAN